MPKTPKTALPVEVKLLFETRVPSGEILITVQFPPPCGPPPLNNSTGDVAVNAGDALFNGNTEGTNLNSHGLELNCESLGVNCFKYISLGLLGFLAPTIKVVPSGFTFKLRISESSKPACDRSPGEHKAWIGRVSSQLIVPPINGFFFKESKTSYLNIMPPK